MKPIPIVIVSHNTLPYTRRAIESVMAYSHYPFSVPYRLIVVDNGSTDGTVEYLIDLEGSCDLCLADSNLGWIKGVNRGLEMALDCYDPDYTIISNSDIVIPGDPWWLHKYIELLQDEEVGAVGPVSNFVMGLQKYEFNPQLPPVHKAKFLIGFFVAVKAKVLREIGLLDERFGLGGNDDLDLSIRIRQAGYKLLINRRAFVFHYGSRTLLQKDVFDGWEGIKREDERTRVLLVEKWGQETVNELFTMPPGIQGQLRGGDTNGL